MSEEVGTDQVKLPSDAELKKKVGVSNEHGLVGVVLGNKQSAPTNAAFLLCVILLVVFLIVLFAPLDQKVERQTLVMTIFSAVTGTAGYIFGRSR